jgi:CheY-like chemotaxis protein
MRNRMAMTPKQTTETWIVERPGATMAAKPRRRHVDDESPRWLADVSFTSRTLPSDRSMGSTERSGYLTPYAIEGILEDALWMGRGARVEVRLARQALPDDVSWLRARLAGLAQRDIDVDVRRDARVEAPVPRLLPGPRRPRVAVAEDNVEMRRLIAATLRGDGYEVVEAGDGSELITQLEMLGGAQGPARTAVELIVSDLRMPGLSGMDVLGAIRDGNWRTPFILITAFGDEDTHQEAHDLGAAAVLDKPFDLERLRTLVHESVPPPDL